MIRQVTRTYTKPARVLLTTLAASARLVKKHRHTAELATSFQAASDFHCSSVDRQPGRYDPLEQPHVDLLPPIDIRRKVPTAISSCDTTEVAVQRKQTTRLVRTTPQPASNSGHRTSVPWEQPS